MGDTLTTCGDYKTERDAELDFDRLIGAPPDALSDLDIGNFLTEDWKVFRQVACKNRGEKTGGSGRIDRILIPTPTLVQKGWYRGAIGVEIKKTGLKANSPIKQASSYSTASFKIPIGGGGGGVEIIVEAVFLFPLEDPGSLCSSLMNQLRVGTCHKENTYPMPAKRLVGLQFKFAQQVLYTSSGGPRVNNLKALDSNTDFGC